jgi:hypothetical protein
MFDFPLSFEKLSNMDTNQTTETYQDRPRQLPGMLNVLTILTFIGCGIGYIGSLYNFFFKGTSDIEKFQEQLDNAGDNSMLTKIAEGGIMVAQKEYDNRLILFISAILFTTLCLVGALQMRKLKKSGYLLYVIGELAPILVFAVIIGFASIMASIMTVVVAVVALVFVILYSTQRKYLVN